MSVSKSKSVVGKSASSALVAPSSRPSLAHRHQDGIRPPSQALGEEALRGLRECLALAYRKKEQVPKEIRKLPRDERKERLKSFREDQRRAREKEPLAEPGMRRFFSVGARAALRKLNDGQLDLLAMDVKMPADAIRIGLMNGLHSCAALELEGLSQASSDILGFPASIVGISFPEVESAEEERVPQFKRLREIAEELRKSKAPLEPDYTEKSAANATADTDQKSKAKADRESLQSSIRLSYLPRPLDGSLAFHPGPKKKSATELPGGEQDFLALS